MQLLLHALYVTGEGRSRNAFSRARTHGAPSLVVREWSCFDEWILDISLLRTYLHMKSIHNVYKPFTLRVTSGKRWEPFSPCVPPWMWHARQCTRSRKAFCNFALFRPWWWISVNKNKNRVLWNLSFLLTVKLRLCVLLVSREEGCIYRNLAAWFERKPNDAINSVPWETQTTVVLIC